MCAGTTVKVTHCVSPRHCSIFSYNSVVILLFAISNTGKGCPHEQNLQSDLEQSKTLLRGDQ